jgi:hypothetical protein
MTICPGPASTNIFSMLSLPLPTAVAGTTQSAVTVNATAVLPNGSTTVFSSSVTPAPNSSPERIGAADAARILIDGNGCQTLFVPKTTAVCSTTLRPMVLPDLVVSRCDQWVTFSSNTKLCVDIPEPTKTVVPVESTVSSDEPIVTDIPPPAGPTLDEALPTPEIPQATGDAPTLGADPSMPTGFDPSYTKSRPGPMPIILTLTESSIFTSNPILSLTQSSIFASNPIFSLTASSPSPIIDPPPPDISSDPLNQTVQLNDRQAAALPTTPPPPHGSPSGPGTWYAAPWYAIARGGVPPQVRAVECENAAAKCTTYNERWSVTTIPRTTTETVPVTYSGVSLSPFFHHINTPALRTLQPPISPSCHSITTH